MLPLWRDRLHIVLSPEHVSIVRLGMGLKPSQIFSKSLPCALPAQGELAWMPALRTMKQLLQQAGSGKADAEVVLSNHFVRYQLIAAQSDLGSLDEEQGFVRFSFSEVYGDEVNQWSLRWGSGLDIAPQPASAVDQALITQLESTLTASQVKLISLQPYLMAAFNHVRNLIDVKPQCFVLVEPGRVCFGLLRDGDWQTLHASRIGPDWAAELPNVIARELQMVGTVSEPMDMLLCLPGYFDHKRLGSHSQSLRVMTMTAEMLQQGAVKSVTNMGVKL